MNLKTKLLELSEPSYYFIVIAQGDIDREALKRIFDEIEKIRRPLANCKVLIDQEEANVNLRPKAIRSITNQFELHLSSQPFKMAVVASKFDRCGRLHLLGDLLCSQGLRVAVFDNTKAAGSWLSDGT